MIEIEVAGLSKSFGQLKVLDKVDLQVEAGSVVSLVGPSGSGKSTLLRCLNLLEHPDQGRLLCRGTEIPYASLTPLELSRYRANLGMVFQHFYLFPHRTVLGNVIEGPVQVLNKSPEEARQRGIALLERVGLGSKLDAWPAQLSGGQKQRVAIARALAMEPDALLLDEVTSALDIELVSGINDLLRELASEMTMVLVTHDLAFARTVSSQMHFFDGGRILESGPPGQLLDNPTTPRLREFLQAVR